MGFKRKLAGLCAFYEGWTIGYPTGSAHASAVGYSVELLPEPKGSVWFCGWREDARSGTGRPSALNGSMRSRNQVVGLRSL